MTTTTPVLMIIFAFTFIPLILAELARHQSVPTIEDFFLQNRTMPLLFVFATVYATWVSSFAFLGSTGQFYMNGPVYLTAFAWNALYGVLFMVIGKRIWHYGRTYGYVTPTDFFADIYGSRTLNFIVTITMLLFTLPYLQIQLSGGAYLIEVASGGQIPWRISGLLFYLIIVIYLWAGGMRAVAFTDLFYGVLIFISMIAIGFFLINRAGGYEAAFSTIRDMDANQFTLIKGDNPSPILTWLSMFVIIPLGAIMGPPIWLRIYAVGSKKTFAIMPFLLTIAAIMYLGSILSGSAGILLEPNLQKSDLVLPTLLANYASPVMATLFFCGIASAALSTANSQIHSVSAIYSIDLHRRYINPSVTEKRLVDIGKWVVLSISALAYLLMLTSPEGLIIDTGTLAMSGTAQIVVPTVGALFWKHSNHQGALAGLTGGLLVLGLLRGLLRWSASYCGAIALLTNVLLFIIVGLKVKGNPITREKIYSYREEYRRNH